MERSNSMPAMTRLKTSSAEVKGLDEDRPQSEIGDETQRRSRTLNFVRVVDREDLRRARTLSGANLRRKITHVNRLLEQPVDISVLEKQRDELDKLREKVNEAHDNYYSNLESMQEITEAYRWLDLRDREHFHSRTRVNERIKALEQKRAYDMVSHRSSQSSKSSRSSGKSTSSLRAKRVKAAAKTASLLVEMNFIDQEKEYKRQQTLKNIAKAKAEEEAFGKFEEELERRKILRTHDIPVHQYSNAGPSEEQRIKRLGMGTRIYNQDLICEKATSDDKDIPDVSDSWPAMPNNEISTTVPVELNADAQEFIPLYADAAVLTNDEREANPKNETNVCKSRSDDMKYEQQEEPNNVGPILVELAKQQALNSLPKQQPPVFSGNYFEYPYFINSFESLIESRVEDPKQRLYYLHQFTSGEAREVIKSLVTLNSPEAYTKARAVLKERFGHPYRVAHAYKEKLLNWNGIKELGDGAGLLKFSDFLAQTEEAMKTLRHMEILNNEDVIKKICSKLPNFSIARWCRRANEILAKEDTVNFHHFVEFVKDEATFATNPVFSPYAIKEERKGDKKIESKEQEIRKLKRKEYSSSFSTNVVSQSPHGKDRSPPGVHKCILCARNHALENCQKFQEMQLAERKDFIRKKELCFGCLRVGHVSRRCLTRKKCDVCQLKHPTLLHDTTKGGKRKDARLKLVLKRLIRILHTLIPPFTIA